MCRDRSESRASGVAPQLRLLKAIRHYAESSEKIFQVFTFYRSFYESALRVDYDDTNGNLLEEKPNLSGDKIPFRKTIVLAITVGGEEMQKRKLKVISDNDNHKRRRTEKGIQNGKERDPLEN
ncbi:unnamed protein product [Vicia faba]|uniref:Uncharacterized protein n=1 Tax=Vicia faba TaxID=3906 RepID=A0AAV1A8G4_VICFA|nr:unnamed protein product [Vicia faba]